jgi:hypothetical protein
MVGMKARVETCDLRHIRHTVKHSFNRRKIVGLMQRSQGNQLQQVGQNPSSQNYRPFISLSTMDHTMTYSEYS